MAAANASARGQRGASPLHELTGFYLAVDCLASGCNGERSFAVAELASFYGWDCTVGQVLRRMRCSGASGESVGAALLETAPILNARGSRGACRCSGCRRRSSTPAEADTAENRSKVVRRNRSESNSPP